jgi:hypothetical protein
MALIPFREFQTRPRMRRLKGVLSDMNFFFYRPSSPYGSDATLQRAIPRFPMESFHGFRMENLTMGVYVPFI